MVRVRAVVDVVSQLKLAMDPERLSSENFLTIDDLLYLRLLCDTAGSSPQERRDSHTRTE